MVETVVIAVLLIVLVPFFKARRFSEIDRRHEMRRAIEKSQGRGHDPLS